MDQYLLQNYWGDKANETAQVLSKDRQHGGPFLAGDARMSS
jgi:hypothetical protein